jgi:GNAT superfamily N-acetyltransferase
MSITPATTADIPALVPLINGAYRGEGGQIGWTNESHLISGARTSPQDLEELLHNPGATILKLTGPDNTILGCVYLQAQGDRLYLGLLSVLPSHQNAGIGKQFLTTADDYARRHHCTHIHITVISVRTELVAWYERHGFNRTGDFEPFHHGEKFGIAKEKLHLAVLEKPVSA